MPAHWQILTQKQADIKNAAAAIIDAAEEAGRSFSADERTRLDAFAFQRQKIDADLERALTARDEERATTFVIDDPNVLAAEGRLGEGSRITRTGGRTYADLFGPPARSGWKSGEEFLATVASGLHDPRLSAGGISAIATGVSPSDGGFFVPSELAAEMLDASLEKEIVRPRATVHPMISSTKKIAGFDASSSSSTLFGAFTGQWVEEGAEITVETPKTRLIELVARKLAVLAEVSNELVADGRGYSNSLQDTMIDAISWFLDYAFLVGTGAGQPRGVLNDPAIISVAKEVGQDAATITYVNLADMMNRLHPKAFDNAVWIANQGVRAQLLQLSQTIGVGGAAVPALTESNGKFRLLTLPVIFTEKLPQIGTTGDVILADLSQYQIGLRADMRLDKSIHPGFTRDTSHFRGLLRGDGMGAWNTAYTPKNGATQSWVVSLATRA